MTHLSDMASTQAINNWLERTGQKRKSEKPPLGWRCPVCGCGLAPQLTMCPCEGSDIALKINHLERVIKRKIDWIEYLENEAVSTTPSEARE